MKGPVPLLAEVRSRGSRRGRRSAASRQRLRRIIHLVDRVVSSHGSGGNCYRRALLEMATDAGAAREPLQIGLRALALPRSGHAWIGSDIQRDPYDVLLSL